MSRARANVGSEQEGELFVEELPCAADVLFGGADVADGEAECELIAEARV